MVHPDYETEQLVTPNEMIKLNFTNTNNYLPPRVGKVTIIWTIIIEIPECLTIAKRAKSWQTSILNDTEETVTFDFTEPILVEKLDKLDFQEIGCNNIKHSTKSKFDISKIRTNHLNSEENFNV